MSHLYPVYNGLLIPLRLAAAPLGPLLNRVGSSGSGEWAQRLGYGPSMEGVDIWVQAASVGEVRVASTLLRAVSTRWPGLRVAVSATTRTGRALAGRLFADAGIGTAYFPLDFPAAVRRRLRALRPRLLLTIETEIWPNLLRECHRADTRSMVVNGRISPRAYSRYGLVRRLMRDALVFLDSACVQTPEDARRFESLGLPAGRISVTGNMKYDAPPPPDREAAGVFRRGIGVPEGAFLIVAGSTAAGEDQIVLDAFETLRAERPGCRLLIAPRHPERFGEAGQLASGRGFRVRYRSEAPRPGDREGEPDVVILDNTHGELMTAYAASRAVFVGGSLVPVGGQNILEPASCGLAPIVGPHTENFDEPARRLEQAGGLVRVRNARELAAAWRAAVDEPEAGARAGERARSAIAEGSGAIDRTLDCIGRMIDGNRTSRGAA